MRTKISMLVIQLITFFMLQTTAPAQAQSEWGDCSETCTWSTDCSWDCLDGSLFTTCGGYGVCGSPPPPPPSNCTTDSCAGAACGVHPVDADCDGVPEQLEYDLAHRFFPNVLLQHQVPDVNQAYLKLGRATPYTVQPLLPPSGICNEAFECLEIRFAIAFRNDCGDILPWESSNHCDTSTSLPNKGHVGDSEFYAALVQRTASWNQAKNNSSQWVLIRDFTSAHWDDGGDSSRIGAYGDSPCTGWGQAACNRHRSVCNWGGGFCYGTPVDPGWSCGGSEYFSCTSVTGCSWYPDDCVRRDTIAVYSSSPKTGPATIYSAESKHALYHSDWECDNGGVTVIGGITSPADECPRSSYPSSHNLRNYKAGKLQNIGWISDGTDGQSSNCIYRDTQMQHPDWCGLYNVWSGARFANSTDYRQKFYARFDWALPGS